PAADHQRGREGPGLAGHIADIGDVDAGFLLQFARDRGLDRLARLDEAGECRIAARRIMRLAAEKQPAVMLGKHDDDWGGPGGNLRPPNWGAPRPDAAQD